MIAGIEPLYRTIGMSINGQLREPWSVAWMEAIFYPGCHVFWGTYVVREGDRPKSFELADDSQVAFQQIRKLFEQAGKLPWGRARFELRSNGKFGMTFGYDDCDAKGFANFDEETELKRTKALRDLIIG